MTHVFKMSAAAALLALLGGCSTLSSMNPFSSALKPAELKAFTPELKTTSAWSVDVGDSDQGVFTPVESAGVVYAASQEGVLLAIEKSTGKVKWKVKVAPKLKTGVAATLDTLPVDF